MPEAYLNAFPVVGKQRKDIGELIVQSLVDTKNPTRKIVFIGGDLKRVMSGVKMNVDTGRNESIGVYSGGSIYINGELISEAVDTWKAVEALKLNASLATIVFHYKDLNEIQENGLGFDTIDKIFVTAQFAKDNQNVLDTLEGYKNLGLPLHIETL
jgi:hypothetical protein